LKPIMMNLHVKGIGGSSRLVEDPYRPEPLLVSRNKRSARNATELRAISHDDLGGTLSPSHFKPGCWRCA
jgi:hypothetical protein